jgi:hypothetical protein
MPLLLPVSRATAVVAVVVAVAVFVGATGGCRTDPAPHPPPSSTAPPREPMRPLTPAPARRFVLGAELLPASTLRPWLLARGDVVLRLPVVVDRGVAGLRGGRVGELDVTLDDTALGVGLLDRLRSACPGAGPCHAWIEARVGAGPDDGPALRLRVLRFDRAVIEGDRIVVEVEAPPGVDGDGRTGK